MRVLVTDCLHAFALHLSQQNSAVAGVYRCGTRSGWHSTWMMILVNSVADNVFLRHLKLTHRATDDALSLLVQVSLLGLVVTAVYAALLTRGLVFS